MVESSDPSEPAGAEQSERGRGGEAERDPGEQPPTGIAEPLGPAGAEQRPDPPHHPLNNPVGEPDPTEWPDPYESRPDPRGPEVDTAAVPLEGADPGTSPSPEKDAPSTSEPHPRQDVEVDPRRIP